MKISRQNPPKVGDVIEFVSEARFGYRVGYRQTEETFKAHKLLVLEDPNMSLYKTKDWAFCKCLDLDTNIVDQFGFDLRTETHTIISRLDENDR